MKGKRCRAGLAAVLLALPAAGPAAAQAGFGSVEFQGWGFFQRNEDGSNQWKYDPRLYIPYRLANGATFTQRIDVPLIYTNESGAGNPGGGYSGGVGDMFIEEYLESAPIAENLRLKASVRFIFPTGKQAPFGNSQYQWAPAGGLIYAMPNLWRGVTLEPYVRYLSGFSPLYDNVKDVRKLELYPAATVVLSDGWSLVLYPDNPITYNEQKKTWFVPLDLMLARKIDRKLEAGIGGAWKLGNPSDPSYRYIIDARLIVSF